jgi:ribosomal subunit interface protein
MVNITYKYNDLEEAKSLKLVMDQKLAMLEKFVSDGVPALCEVEFAKAADHQSGRVFRVETNLTINGKMYRAEATEESFERAIDEVRSELDKELSRAKDKESSLLKRAGRRVKETLLRR